MQQQGKDHRLPSRRDSLRSGTTSIQLRFRGRTIQASLISQVTRCLTAFCLLSGTAQPAAPEVLEGSLLEDARLADSIILAKVAAVSYEVIEGRPYTMYDLQEIEELKATNATTSRLRILGGPTGAGHWYRSEDVPEFSVGSRVLLFLRFDNPVCPILGLKKRVFFKKEPDGPWSRDSEIVTFDRRSIVGLDGLDRIATQDEDPREPDRADESFRLQDFLALIATFLAADSTGIDR